MKRRMDPEAYIRWALDDARTLEERYTTELLVEQAEQTWHALNKTGQHRDWQEGMERKRQRYLNPAYDPHYTEMSVRRAAEIFPRMTQWSIGAGYQERPVRDISVIRFLTALETLSISCDIPDISLVAELPALRALSLHSPLCEDYRPLARCTGLRSLTLSLGVPWPEVAGIEKLQQLETLVLGGNLLVFERGISFPLVREGSLNCSPLCARSMREMPQLPACEFLTLAGVDSLDGIDRFPRLRNLMLNCCVRDFAPLAALADLTWFHHAGGTPLDVAPLARLPRLLVASFHTQHVWGVEKAPLRDYSPITASRTLRELHVVGCPPLEVEVAAINATLPPWDDLLLAPSPRAVPPLRMIIAPHTHHPRRNAAHRGPDEPELQDKGIRKCEEQWVARFARQFIAERIGHTDWGDVKTRGESRSMCVVVECYEVVERLPEIIDAAREAMARLRYEYLGDLWISLTVPVQKPTPVQLDMLRQYQEDMDRADHERRQKEQRERLEREYLLQLKKQEGAPIDPEEFAPGEQEQLPPPPWEIEEDEPGGDDDGEGGIAVKHKPDPPPDPWDNEHPLADNYRLSATFTLEKIWFDPRQAGLAIHLMGREADEEIPDEKQQS